VLYLLVAILILWGIVIVMTYIKVSKILDKMPIRANGTIDRRFGKREKSLLIPPETKLIDKPQTELILNDDGGLL
jgi:hypothetical protein